MSGNIFVDKQCLFDALSVLKLKPLQENVQVCQHLGRLLLVPGSWSALGAVISGPAAALRSELAAYDRLNSRM